MTQKSAPLSLYSLLGQRIDSERVDASYVHRSTGTATIETADDDKSIGVALADGYPIP